MKAKLLQIITLLILSVGVCFAQNASLDISETTLNRIYQRLGVRSDGGVAQPYSLSNVPGLFEFCHHVGYLGCPGLPGNDLGLKMDRVPIVICKTVGGGDTVALPSGEPVPWQWWISDVKVRVTGGAMTFTATVTTHVGDAWKTIRRTVGATIRYDSNANTLNVDIADFKVNLRLDENTTLDVDPVDVGKYYSIALPIHPQAFSVPLPGGATRNITGRVIGASVEFLPCKLRVNFDVGF